MASRQAPPASPAPEVPVPTPEQIQRGVAKLKKRIEEVKALATDGVSYKDQRVQNAEQNIRSTILDVFGASSPQYQTHLHHTIWDGGIKIGMTPQESQRRFASGVPRTVAMLENLIANLEELAGDGTSPPRRARAAFSNLELHPRIERAAANLYEGGYYRNAVLDAALALVQYVKEKSGRSELDGAALTTTVFSVKQPVLAVNDLANQSDTDEQQGFMHLLTGAVLAFRNPRAHDLDPDTPEYALECIAFLSMLAKRVDSACRR